MAGPLGENKITTVGHEGTNSHRSDTEGSAVAFAKNRRPRAPLRNIPQHARQECIGGEVFPVLTQRCPALAGSCDVAEQRSRQMAFGSFFEVIKTKLFVEGPCVCLHFVYPMRIARKSLTLVPVGPVTNTSLVALNPVQASLETSR